MHSSLRGTLACLAMLTLAFLPVRAIAQGNASPEAKARASAILETMKVQTDSWNRGDLDGFMSAYLPSGDMTFTSGGILVRGYDTLKARYQKFYGSNPQSMGTLRFEGIEFMDLGKDTTLSVGRFILQRSGQPAVDGIFSLVWVRTKAGWRILHDHSSAPHGQGRQHPAGHPRHRARPSASPFPAASCLKTWSWAQVRRPWQAALSPCTTRDGSPMARSSTPASTAASPSSSPWVRARSSPAGIVACRE